MIHDLIIRLHYPESHRCIRIGIIMSKSPNLILTIYRCYSKSPIQSSKLDQIDKNDNKIKSQQTYKGILLNIPKSDTPPESLSTDPKKTIFKDHIAYPKKQEKSRTLHASSSFDIIAMINCHKDSLDIPTGKIYTNTKPLSLRFMHDVSRYHSHQTFIPAEELFDLPVLSSRISSSLTKHSILKLKRFQMPVLSSQIESSLSEEFGTYIISTPWNLFNPFNTSFYEAARLVQERFLYERAKESMLTRFPFDKDLPKQKNNLLFIPNKSSIIKQADIMQECDQLYQDISTKSYSRYNDHDELTKSIQTIPEKWIPVFKHASLALGKNSSLHPVMKHDVMNIIHRVLLLGDNK